MDATLCVCPAVIFYEELCTYVAALFWVQKLKPTLLLRTLATSSVNRELTHLAATLAAAQCAPSQNIFMAFLHKMQATQSVFS